MKSLDPVVLHAKHGLLAELNALHCRPGRSWHHCERVSVLPHIRQCSSCNCLLAYRTLNSIIWLTNVLRDADGARVGSCDHIH